MSRNNLLRLTAACCLSLLTTLPAESHSGLGEFFLGKSVGPTGKYKKGNIIKVEASVPRDALMSDAWNNGLSEISRLTSEKGFSRFAVVKSVCGTYKMSGVPLYHTCNITAQMVSLNEEAKPIGKQSIKYFNVADPLIAVSQ